MMSREEVGLKRVGSSSSSAGQGLVAMGIILMGINRQAGKDAFDVGLDKTLCIFDKTLCMNHV